MKPMIVVGLTFGDEGKGTITDYLARTTRAGAVVRFNGGPQAGHNVVTEDGRWHCFAQIGAGAFVRGTKTIHGPEMRVELENLEVEAGVLAAKGVPDPLATITIDQECAVVTPMHKMLSQMKEVGRGASPKGTCGLGVGEAGRRRVTVREIGSSGGAPALDQLLEECMVSARALALEHPSEEMDRLLHYFAGRCRPADLLARYRGVLERVTVESSRDALARARGEAPVIFEGAQGALLDRAHGFAPFVTGSRTTCHGAIEMLGEPVHKIGVLRAYGHRHGPGPFATEDPSLLSRFSDRYNPENRWQGPFRVGWMDLVAIRYGIAVNGGIDRLAVTGLDRLSGLARIRLSNGYPLEWIELPGWTEDLSSAKRPSDLPKTARAFLDFLESDRGLGVRIGIVSVGPGAHQKIAWT
jgi:adenylosuccinate synthase